MDGIDYLRSKLKEIPEKAGVYRMLNEKEDVLYVGKAKNLKNRLTQYTQEQGLSNRIRKMVFETRKLLIVETSSEQEALLLEINLIQEMKPKYNVIFRDDASYPYILVTKHNTPRLTSYRGTRRNQGYYFGPYPDVKAMRSTLEELEKIFHLRTCTDTDFKTRTRPCLKYDIKRCSAPCVHKISSKEYAENVKEAKAFLKGKGESVQNILKDKMLQASDSLKFEQAAKLRDRLAALSKTLQKQTVASTSFFDADFIAVGKVGQFSNVILYAYRNGRQVGHELFFPKGTEDVEANEVIKAFVSSYYSKNPLPKHIYLEKADEDLKDFLHLFSTAKNTKIQLALPQKGEKKIILEKACQNAVDALKRKQAKGASWAAQMKHFADVLQTSTPVKRIETFDISNISGRYAVASMVVAGEEGMLKNDYRKFEIKDKNRPDDYAMMRQVLTRRYGRVLKELQKAQAENTPLPAVPNVIMVDGGKGHLRVLTEVIDSLNWQEGRPHLCAIAKGEFRDKGLETIFQQGKETPLEIDYNSPLKFMLQIIRDESHRFAIGYHRQKRSKETFKSALDRIPGVGPKRKKALLLKFGSVDALRHTSVEDIATTEGVSLSLAEVIKSYL